ncbi:MAG: putative integral rane protein [Conexibacter sp.]|nr:putative integral rane protein [Conexibacter sp.]
MSTIITAALVIAIVARVIHRQLAGEPLRGKRLIVLPVVLTAIGGVDLAGKGTGATTKDIILICVSAAIALGIGLGQGRAMRLERRDGALWGQLPTRALWLWGGLIGSRLVIILIAHAGGATVAAGTDSILLALGVNRLAQALVVAWRAYAAGIPFAPEDDGSTFAAGLFPPRGGARA